VCSGLSSCHASSWAGVLPELRMSASDSGATPMGRWELIAEALNVPVRRDEASGLPKGTVFTIVDAELDEVAWVRWTPCRYLSV